MKCEWKKCLCRFKSHRQQRHVISYVIGLIIKNITFYIKNEILCLQGISTHCLLKVISFDICGPNKVLNAMFPRTFRKQTQTLFRGASGKRSLQFSITNIGVSLLTLNVTLSTYLPTRQKYLPPHSILHSRFFNSMTSLTYASLLDYLIWQKSESKLTSCNQSGYKKSTWTNIISRIFFVWHTIDWHVNSIQFTVSFLLLVRSANRKTNRWQNNLKSWGIKLGIKSLKCQNVSPLFVP